MTLSEAQQEIQRIKNQLKRERASRKKAEEILREKSVSLKESNDYLTSMTTRLQSALWLNNQIAWEYVMATDAYYAFKSIDSDQVSVGNKGSLDDIVNTFHKDDCAEFLKHWHTHISGETHSFNVTLRRYSKTHSAYRWVQVVGKKQRDPQHNECNKVVGIFADVNEEYLRKETLNIIGHTFLKSVLPGVIIDFTNKQIVVTDSFTIIMTGSTDALSQQELAKIIPVSVIKQQLTKGVSKFDTDLLVNGKPLSVNISLPSLLHDTSEQTELHYCVAFIHLNRK